MPQLRRLIPSDFTTRLMTSNIEILADEQEVINEEVGENLSFVAASPAMRKIRLQAEVLARVEAPILIVGESGTGKEIVARLIHNRSTRAAKKFLKLSCAALEPDVLERQLFGNSNGGRSDGGARD